MAGNYNARQNCCNVCHVISYHSSFRYSLGKGIMKRKLRWAKKLNRENFIALRSCLTRNVASKNTALNLPEEKCYLPWQIQRRSLLSSRNIRHHTGFLCVLRYFEIYQKKSSGNWSESGLECPLEYLYFALFGFVIGSKISRHFLSQSKPTVIFFRAFLALATDPHVLASTRDWFMLVLGPLLIGHSNWQTTHAIRCLKASNRDLMIRQRRRKWKLHWKTQYAFFHSSNNYTKKAFSLPFTTDIKKEQRVSKPSKDNSLLLLHG